MGFASLYPSYATKFPPMAVECSIRPAADGDAGAISQVIVAALRETNAKDYAPEVIARLEKNFSPAAVRGLIRKQKMFVAVLGQQIVGTAGLDGSMVRSFFVAPNAQGTGIGSRLMAEVENRRAAGGDNDAYASVLGDRRTVLRQTRVQDAA